MSNVWIGRWLSSHLTAFNGRCPAVEVTNPQPFISEKFAVINVSESVINAATLFTLEKAINLAVKSFSQSLFRIFFFCPEQYTGGSLLIKERPKGK